MCHTEQPIENFYKNRTTADGYGDRCKPCGKQYQQTKYWANPSAARAVTSRYRKNNYDKVLAYNRQYSTENPDKAREWSLKTRKKHALNRMIGGARTRAKQRGVPCTITKTDIHVPDTCPILGIPLRMATKWADDSSPSLDCIVPSKGYIPGNVAVISHRANSIKNNATPEELRAVADWMERMVTHPPLLDELKTS